MNGAADPFGFDREPLRALLGTTASGKSAFALELCERAGAEILSLDSMLVYRGLDIGTAKPTPAERARVRHHLIDLAEPHERFDLSSYLAAAAAALADVRARGQRALFVGGTALYLKGLTHGLFDGPPFDPALREALRARAAREGSAALHAELARCDAAAAARIHANDEKRVLRALEVFEQTGRPLSDWQREWRAGESARAGRPRRLAGLRCEGAELERRIEQRARAMLDQGWVAEALALERAGLGPTAVQALGYAEVLEFAHGRATREQCLAAVVLATRQFARRQRTWLRKFPEIEWLDAPQTETQRAHALQRALAILEWT